MSDWKEAQIDPDKPKEELRKAVRELKDKLDTLTLARKTHRF